MWGDPFELHDEGASEQRAELLKHEGIVLGALIRYGSTSKEGMFLWDRPEASAMIRSSFTAMFGMILAIDVTSDPSTDWLMLYLSTSSSEGSMTIIGWAPASLVTVL